jgi:alanyl-tRNA synthetase
VGSLVRGSDEEVAERVARLVAQQKDLEKQLKQLQSKLAGSQSGDLMARARQVNGMTVLATDVADLDDAALRELSDRLRQQIGSGVVVLGTTRGDRVVLLAAVTKDLTDRVRAGDIIKKIAPLIGGGGGGKPEMAQAGGREPGKLKEALETVYQIVR